MQKTIKATLGLDLAGESTTIKYLPTQSCLCHIMVPYKSIQASNALISKMKQPIIAVFVGGTSGIGKATIEALVATGASARIHLIGRKSSEERMLAFKKNLQSINPRAELVWSEAEIALLADASRVCRDITNKESHVDLLFMSTGYAPFGGRKETTEGLEVTQSLEFYTRILFIQLLLPLLRKADSARVVSVLAGGLEPMSITLDDLDLKSPSNFAGFKAQGHYAAMGTLTLEKLAKSCPEVTFVHSFPGWVKTGNHRRGAEPDSMLARIVWPISEPLIGMMSLGVNESGQRHLFESTSAFFGGRGVAWDGELGMNSMQERANGLFLVNQKCECTSNTKNMRALRANASEKVFAHTEQVLRPYVSVGSRVLP